MQVNIMVFYIPMVLGWDQKGKYFFLKKVMLHNKLTERSVVRAREMFIHMHIPDLLVWVNRSDTESVQESIL